MFPISQIIAVPPGTTAPPLRFILTVLAKKINVRFPEMLQLTVALEESKVGGKYTWILPSTGMGLSVVNLTVTLLVVFMTKEAGVTLVLLRTPRMKTPGMLGLSSILPRVLSVVRIMNVPVRPGPGFLMVPSVQVINDPAGTISPAPFLANVIT